MKRTVSVLLAAALAFLPAAVGFSAPIKAPAFTFAMEPAFEPGDVNGNGIPDAEDARFALRCAVQLEIQYRVWVESPPVQDPGSGKWSFGGGNNTYISDLDGDNRITAADARCILRRAVGLDGYEPLQADDGIFRLRTGGFSFSLGALDALRVSGDVPVMGFGDADLPLWRITSAEELEAWLAAYNRKNEKELTVPSFLHRYGSAFFETRDLFICLKAESSGSFYQAAYAPVVENGVLTLSFGTAYLKNAFGTDDEGEWFLFQPIEKSVTAACSEFVCKPAEPLWLEGPIYVTPADPGTGNEEPAFQSADLFRARTYGLPYDYERLGALTALQINKELVTGRRPADLPLWRIASAEDLKAWFAAFRQVEPENSTVPAFLQTCDQSFFESQELFVCYKIESSGSYFQIVDPPAALDGELTVTVHTAYFYGAAGTCDMAQWFLFIPVEKSVAADCKVFTCKAGAPVTLERPK